MNRYSICESDLNRKMSVNLLNQPLPSNVYTHSDKKRARLESLKNIALLDGRINYWKDQIDPSELKLSINDTERA